MQNKKQEALPKKRRRRRLNLEAAWEIAKTTDERTTRPFRKATQSKGIDWNDPSVLKYHALKNKHVSIAQARNILEEPRRYPIVNWEYQLPGRMEITDIEVYKLTRADGSASFHGDEQDEIWKNQESWKVLRWRLYENSGVHSVFLIDTPMEINMLVEKKYPLKKEILEKMINLKLQAEEESTMAFELIKFTRSQIEEKQ
ncbi:hypothetical protein Tco_1524164 [Tanacetum coccineum]